MPTPLRGVGPAGLLVQAASAAGDARVRFSGEISVGDIATALTVLVSALTLAWTWRRDITLREREYADRVKTAAAFTLARLERAREIMLHFFDVFSTCFVNASTMAVDKKTAQEITNYVWIKAEETAAECNERLLEEEIELAYVELYAYDENIYQQFVDARTRQQQVWERIYSDAKMMTQEDIFTFKSGSHGLGTQLRLTCADLAREFREEADGVLGPLRTRLQSWIQASPRQIVRRTVDLAPAAPAREDEMVPADDVAAAVAAFVRGAGWARLPPELRRPVDRPFGVLRASLRQLDQGGGRLSIAFKRLAERPESAARQSRVMELLRPFRLDQRPAIGAAAQQILALPAPAEQAPAFRSAAPTSLKA